MTQHSEWDVIVLGSGNAGCCAAISAVEHGCKRVLVVDKCPADWLGGNSYFTAGAFRTAHDGLPDLLPILTNVAPERTSTIVIPQYTPDDFAQDVFRMGDNRNDPALVHALARGSRGVIRWLAGAAVGVPFTLSFNRQAYEIEGVHTFWGGLALSTQDGGKGLVRAYRTALARAGVQVWCDSPAVELIAGRGGRITGVVIEKDGERSRLRAAAVILAAGGYEASAEERGRNLGAEWAQARVRGTPYNTGDAIRMAAAVGAKLCGDWRGCHSTCWDANAPPAAGSRELSNQYTKSGYPLGLMLNTRGARFVDEGRDFRNYTYAAYGRAILNEPGGVAFQIFDAKVTGWLRAEEYADGVVEKVWAGSVEELASKLADNGLEDREAFVRTVQEYNDAVAAHRALRPDVTWNPAVKDGLSTGQTLSVAKSNWAQTLDAPPFLAVKVACGITFTFGGVAIEAGTAGVVSEEGKAIEGLFCAGEMIGGLFYGNYPGGSGLTAGAVFGRLAGQSAARLCSVD